MKKTAAAAALILLLTACSEGGKTEETDFMPNHVSETEETVSVTIAETVTEDGTGGTDISVGSDEEETSAPDLAASAGENALPAEAAGEDIFNINGGIDLSDYADEGYSPSVWYTVPAGGNKIAAAFNSPDEDKGGYVSVIDIEENKQLIRIDAPDAGYDAQTARSPGNGEITAFAEFDKFIFSEEPGIPSTHYYALANIYDNGEYSMHTDIPAFEETFYTGGHIITNTGGSLYEGDKVLIKRYEQEDDEWGFYTRSYYYKLPLDENSFVYSIGGYESLPGFGVYDFEAEKARDVPDSRDKLPLGISPDGKIISKEAYWDGWGKELYVTSPDTLETELLCDSPFEIGFNEYVDYFMPADGSYIGALKLGYAADDHICDYWEFALLDPTSGDVTAEYTFPSNELYITSPFFTEDYICFPSQSSNIVLIVKRPPLGFYTEREGDTYNVVYNSFGEKETVLALKEGCSAEITENFSDIMGYSGSKVKIFYGQGEAGATTYYFAKTPKGIICLGESFGLSGGSGYAADIDGDGINELICNCVYMGDGAGESRIYKITENGIMKASGTDLLDMDIALPQANGNTYYSEYLPESGKMTLGCIHKDTKEFYTYEADIDPAALDFYEYEPHLEQWERTGE